MEEKKNKANKQKCEQVQSSARFELQNQKKMQQNIEQNTGRLVNVELGMLAKARKIWSLMPVKKSFVAVAVTTFQIAAPTRNGLSALTMDASALFKQHHRYS